MDPIDLCSSNWLFFKNYETKANACVHLMRNIVWLPPTVLYSSEDDNEAFHLQRSRLLNSAMQKTKNLHVQCCSQQFMHSDCKLEQLTSVSF